MGMQNFWKWLGSFGNAAAGASTVWATITMVASYVDGLPISISVVVGAIAACVFLWAWSNYGQRVATAFGVGDLPTSAGVVPSNTPESPFLLHINGDRAYIEIPKEAGPHGEFRVLKFDLVNAGPEQVEDVEVMITGTSYFHADVIAYPAPIDRYMLKSRQRSTINPGLQAEYVLLSLGLDPSAVPFWGDHKLVPPEDRRYTGSGRFEVREGQHFVTVHVASKRGGSKAFQIHFIVAGTSPPVIFPIDGLRLVSAG